MPAKVPKHAPQFVIFVETNPMIDGVEFMRVVLEEDVTAFSVGVVAEQVEEHNGLEELPVSLGEVEVMIFGIVIDELLERTRTVRAIVAECGERDKVKAKRFTDQVRGDFASCEAVLREIPEWLLTAQGFVNGGVFPVFVMDGDQESVIRAKGELAFNFIIAML